MPRQRMDKRKNWPTGLYTKMVRGKQRYYYKFLDGSSEYFDIGFTELEAIELGRRLSQQDRSRENLYRKRQSIKDKFNVPLKEAMPKVIQLVKDNNELGSVKFKVFLNDCERFIALHGNVLSKSYSDEHVTEYLNKYVVELEKSNSVYNSKITFLKRVEKWLRDQSYINGKFAEFKARLKPEDKKEQPLQIEHFKAIYDAAPHFLKVAMELSLQTTHAVQEIHNVRYDDCQFLEKPFTDEDTGLIIYGYMRIHRLKAEEKEASRVEIPITSALKNLIKFSREDNLLSPYIVHSKQMNGSQPAQECDHPTQCSRDKISKEFSKVRDSLDLELKIPHKKRRKGFGPDYDIVKMADAESAQKPGFHGIRGLSMRLLKANGIDPQSRAGHTDSRSTKVYTEDGVKWTRVKAANLASY